jgi:hypothetical protein
MESDNLAGANERTVTLSPERQTQGRFLTPLWVISLFLSLTETVLGIGVIQTTDRIQVALTIFVLAFPILIAVGFFVILWNRPYVFYAPGEYGKQDVRRYVEAMQLRSGDGRSLFPEIERIVRSRLLSDEVVGQLTNVVSDRAGERIEGQVTKILNSVASRTVESIRESRFITIDARSLIGAEGKVWQIPYEKHATVSGLLDSIWFMLKPYGVPSMRYGRIWALRDATSGKILKEMGRSWAMRHGEVLDTRSLSDVGIKPGSSLEAVPLT